MLPISSFVLALLAPEMFFETTLRPSGRAPSPSYHAG